MVLSSRLLQLLAAALASSSLSAASPLQQLNTTNLDCAALQRLFPQKVFYPGDPVYEYENQEFWSNTEILSPSCIFRPTSAIDVSAMVLSSRLTQGKFAVRSGGHMGIKGANNIDNGVLVVMSNLTTLQISNDHSTVDIGPANRWSDVYHYLTQYNVSVGGGRLGPVGVPGLLLGGGINFYGNQHGFSCDQVVAYEIVLADGLIATVTATENPDLFFALKGGSSNYGIVTKFTMKTVPSPLVWAGVYSVSGDNYDQFLAAVANYSAFNTDPKSHIVPLSVAVSPGVKVASAILFYDSPTVSNPACFEPFLSIPSIASTLAFKTVAEFCDETGQLVVPHINDIFISGTFVGKDYASLLKGMQITSDTFYAALPALYAAVPQSAISLIEIDWQPIGTLWQQGSQATNPSGNALGVDPATKGTYLCFAQVVEWFDSQYDDFIYAWGQNTTAAINAATKAAGLYDPFNYMGDSASFQQIYPGYGSANQQRLLQISREYDPQRVFQTLLPGGFKIGN